MGLEVVSVDCKQAKSGLPKVKEARKTKFPQVSREFYLTGRDVYENSFDMTVLRNSIITGCGILRGSGQMSQSGLEEKSKL